ncbi:MAG: hypothetical protein R8K21_03405 [Mariprofundales bacterium]
MNEQTASIPIPIATFSITKQSVNMLIIGCGYLGEIIGRLALAMGLDVKAVVRNENHAISLKACGIDAYVCHNSPLEAPRQILYNCNILIDSIPLIANPITKQLQAPQTKWLPQLVEHLPYLQRVAYISSTSVYGDYNGQWVDETAICKPASIRGKQRLLSESAWQTAFAATTVFRLAGLYGKERTIFSRLQAGNYTVLSWPKPHYYNRIHAIDAANIILKSLTEFEYRYDILNLADDAPCSHADYAIACAKIIAAPPPLVMKASKQQKHENKRVNNKRLHQIASLQYPTFISGINYLWQQSDV